MNEAVPESIPEHSQVEISGEPAEPASDERLREALEEIMVEAECAIDGYPSVQKKMLKAISQRAHEALAPQGEPSE